MSSPKLDALALMREAIIEAKKSKAEDGRAHPFVGAILTDINGSILARAYRGEARGAHAEFCLFQKAREMGVDTRNTNLFVTLEPCTQRGVGKTPCAVRVVEAGVGTVYIGTLDPNPGISGRGEYFLLSRGLDVHRFPSALQADLRELNGDFFASYEHLLPSSTLTLEADLDEPVEPLATGSYKARDSLLLLTARMISEAHECVLLMGGELSWLKELAITTLLASKRGLDVRMVASRSTQLSSDAEFTERCNAAVGLGAVVSVAETNQRLRGIIVDGRAAGAKCLVVESRPSPHGSILRSPHDAAMIDAVNRAASAIFAAGTIRRPQLPLWREETEVSAANALKIGVREYESAEIRLEQVVPAVVRPLSKSLERLKLLRARETVELQTAYGLPLFAIIDGSPWPVTPPIVERRSDGTLVVIDGTHRLYAALERGDGKVPALVVECDAPLPSDPLSSWKETTLVTEKVPKVERYQRFKGEFFRQCGEAFRRWALPRP